jgi:hypothetical protein
VPAGRATARGRVTAVVMSTDARDTRYGCLMLLLLVLAVLAVVFWPFADPSIP